MTVHHIDTVDSTNTALKRMALSGADCGTVLIADRQTAGHGRWGRAFLSPPGGLYMSLLAGGDHAGDPLLTVAAAVAAARAIEEVCDIQVGIKWVNDLLIDGKKVCGILAQSVTDPARGTLTVVGFGINLVPPAQGFAPAIRDIAGALYPVAPAGLRDRLAAAVARHFFALFENLAAREYLAEYRTRSVLTGQEIAFSENGAAAHGTVLGIDEDGGLTVRCGDAVRTLIAGEVTLHKE